MDFYFLPCVCVCTLFILFNTETLFAIAFNAVVLKDLSYTQIALEQVQGCPTCEHNDCNKCQQVRGNFSSWRITTDFIGALCYEQINANFPSHSFVNKKKKINIYLSYFVLKLHMNSNKPS